MADPYYNAASRFGLPSIGADPDEFFPDYGAQVNPYANMSVPVAAPVAVAPKKKESKDGVYTRYKRYMETGSEDEPVTTPAPGELPADLLAEINSSLDPALTLKRVNEVRKETDYQRGVQEITGLDWKDPQKAMQDMQKIFAARPTAAQELQQFGAGVHRMLGTERPDSRALTGDQASIMQQLFDLDPESPEYRNNRTAILKDKPNVYENERFLRVLERLDDHNRMWRGQNARATKNEGRIDAPVPEGFYVAKQVWDANSRGWVPELAPYVKPSSEQQRTLDDNLALLTRADQIRIPAGATNIDPQKVAAYKLFNSGKEPKTQEEWGMAYDMAVNPRKFAIERIDSVVKNWPENVAVPKSVREMLKTIQQPGVGQSPAPAPAPAAENPAPAKPSNLLKVRLPNGRVAEFTNKADADRFMKNVGLLE